jgi:hypothetical protein
MNRVCAVGSVESIGRICVLCIRAGGDRLTVTTG